MPPMRQDLLELFTKDELKKYFTDEEITSIPDDNPDIVVWEARGNLQHADLLVGRILQMDPYREDAHRQKMRLLSRMGMPEQALAHYEACKRLLMEELGMEPDDATTALAEQLRAENYTGK